MTLKRSLPDLKAVQDHYEDGDITRAEAWLQALIITGVVLPDRGSDVVVLDHPTHEPDAFVGWVEAYDVDDRGPYGIEILGFAVIPYKGDDEVVYIHLDDVFNGVKWAVTQG